MPPHLPLARSPGAIAPALGARKLKLTEQLRCAHCGDVIGVYEPLVALVDGRARETSLAVEQALAGDAASGYHRACYERRHGEHSSGSESAHPPAPAAA
jgi:hypothetical protein